MDTTQGGVMARAAFPDAARLLRFIRAANDAPDSPVRALADFHEVANREFAGPWWGKNHNLNREPKDIRPYSMLGEMLRTYHPHLMGEALMPVVEPIALGNRVESKMLQMRLRRWVDDTAYAAIDEQTVMDCLLGVGVQYVTSNAGGAMFSDGAEDFDTGTPVAIRVPIGNMVVAPGALDWDTAEAIGHRYMVDRQAMLAHGIGNPDVLVRLRNVWESDTSLNQPQNNRDPGRSNADDQHLQDKVWLYDLCFTYAGRRFCCTLPSTGGIDEFVIKPYEMTDEPEGSRYVVTCLNRVNDSLVPLSPAMCLMDAHLSMNTINSKLMEQIKTLRRKIIYKAGSARQVKLLLNPDGDEMVPGDPGNQEQVVLGGMVKELVEGHAFLEALGRKVGPNVDLAGGMQDPSDTATGSSILAGNAAVVMGYWKRKIADGRTRVMRRVASMLTRSFEEMQFDFPLANGMTVPVVWRPQSMSVSYDQFKYQIKPTSNMAGMDARARIRSLAELFQTIPGMVQVAVGMGGDPSKVVRILSDLAESPELDEILPSGDTRSIQMLLLQQLGKNGQVGAGGMGMGMGGGMAPPQGGGMLPSPGPMTPKAQRASDVSRAVPA